MFEQSGELPYDFDFEFPRNRLRFVRVLGSGAFGEVSEYQAFQLKNLQARDKRKAAQNKRKEIRTAKNVSKKIEKYLEKGNRLELAAVKVLKGYNIKINLIDLFDRIQRCKLRQYITTFSPQPFITIQMN